MKATTRDIKVAPEYYYQPGSQNGGKQLGMAAGENRKRGTHSSHNVGDLRENLANAVIFLLTSVRYFALSRSALLIMLCSIFQPTGTNPVLLYNLEPEPRGKCFNVTCATLLSLTLSKNGVIKKLGRNSNQNREQ